MGPKRGLESERERHEKELEETLESLKLLRKFKGLEGISYAYTFKGTDISLTADEEHLQTVLKAALTASGAKRGTKTIDQFSGSLVYTFKNADSGLTVEVRTQSTRCKVRPVTKKVWREAEPGHYTTETRYVIENPEECLGVEAAALLNGEEPKA